MMWKVFVCCMVTFAAFRLINGFVFCFSLSLSLVFLVSAFCSLLESCCCSSTDRYFVTCSNNSKRSVSLYLRAHAHRNSAKEFYGARKINENNEKNAPKQEEKLIFFICPCPNTKAKHILHLFQKWKTSTCKYFRIVCVCVCMYKMWIFLLVARLFTFWALIFLSPSSFVCLFKSGLLRLSTFLFSLFYSALLRS